MKKKIYQQPKMEVVEIEEADIICTSGQPNPSGASFQDLEEGEFEW